MIVLALHWLCWVSSSLVVCCYVTALVSFGSLQWTDKVFFSTFILSVILATLTIGNTKENVAGKSWMRVLEDTNRQVAVTPFTYFLSFARRIVWTVSVRFVVLLRSRASFGRNNYFQVQRAFEKGALKTLPEARVESLMGKEETTDSALCADSCVDARNQQRWWAGCKSDLAVDASLSVSLSMHVRWASSIDACVVILSGLPTKVVVRSQELLRVYSA